MTRLLFILGLYICFSDVCGQGVLQGYLKNTNQQPIMGATLRLEKTVQGAITDSLGFFRIENVTFGEYTLLINGIGIEPVTYPLVIREKLHTINIVVQQTDELEGVVVSGTLKETRISESPILVETYTERFLQKNPSSNFADALQNINGIRPQVTCSVCGTTGIQINGMEAPYTMVLIDGMPIVSGLGTVYGLSGIPTSLIKRIEIVKGAASTLYGSEAVGGLINIITKSPQQADRFTLDMFATSHQEWNGDFGFAKKWGKFSTTLSANTFYFDARRDINQDNFIDIPLQKRWSVFNKWNIERNDNKKSSLALRYVQENRLGGEMAFQDVNRGSDNIYGESIYTKRFEIIGHYDLPTKENFSLMYSFNTHHQDSFYGNTFYLGNQHIAFAQMLWNKTVRQKHEWLAGVAFRYTFYDDNSPATTSLDGMNKPSRMYLPGVFIQNETKFNQRHSLLLATRYDYNSSHGSVLTPRLAYKFTANEDNIVRLNIGRGFRVVNLFTEDHAALTGARQVIMANELRPEQSWNANLSYQKTIVWKKNVLSFEGNAFYTHFTNRILPDYQTDSNLIIYDNLSGFSAVRGASLNLDWMNDKGLKVVAGFTAMQSFVEENNQRTAQVLVSPFSGTFNISYTFAKIRTSIDWTGNLFSPMPLVTVEDDPRPSQSPWYSIQNIQLTAKINHRFQVYGGVKNLFNFVPKNPLFNSAEPFSETFDTAYGFAPIQGIRGFLGLRWHID
jgi:outer membrane receptor for ferrienterochelin and colicins